MAGFFGKLPVAGDFVARGLPQGVRPVLDRWLTRYLARAARRPEDWPEDGLCAVIEGPAGPLSLAMIASHDAAGRPFPLAACAAQDSASGADCAGLEAWAALAVPMLMAARMSGQSADALCVALQGLADPDPGTAPLVAPCLWAQGRAPGDPARTVADLFPRANAEAAP